MTDAAPVDDLPSRSILLAHTAQIVAAHIGHNSVSAADVPALIRSVHEALAAAGAEPVQEAPLEPAVPIRRSIQPDYLVCLEDGRKLKMLKRHLNNAYGMTPEAYRAKWGLPHDYPMVAPNYSRQRSKLAKDIGLGTQGRGSEAAAAAPAAAASEPAPKTTRARRTPAAAKAKAKAGEGNGRRGRKKAPAA